jgi:hypothetical protein
MSQEFVEKKMLQLFQTQTKEQHTGILFAIAGFYSVIIERL